MFECFVYFSLSAFVYCSMRASDTGFSVFIFLMSSLASPFVSICMKCETNYTKGMNINQSGTSTMQATLKHQLIRSKLYL